MTNYVKTKNVHMKFSSSTKMKSASKRIKDSEIDYSKIQKFSAKDLKKFKRADELEPVVRNETRDLASIF